MIQHLIQRTYYTSSHESYFPQNTISKINAITGFAILLITLLFYTIQHKCALNLQAASTIDSCYLRFNHYCLTGPTIVLESQIASESNNYKLLFSF